MAVIRILRGRVRRPWHCHPVGSGKNAEVIIETMVLFDDEHDVLDWPTSSMRWLLPSRLHFSTFVFLDHLYHLCISFSVFGLLSADRYGRLQSWLATLDTYDAIGEGGMLHKG